MDTNSRSESNGTLAPLSMPEYLDVPSAGQSTINLPDEARQAEEDDYIIRRQERRRLARQQQQQASNTNASSNDLGLNSRSETIETTNTARRRKGRLERYIRSELDKEHTRIPLAINCFLSGFIGSVTFSATSVWVGYQTGNTVQTAMAIARVIYPSSTGEFEGFRANDWQALTSLLCFAIACQVGGRLHFRLKRTSRIWIMASVFVQMLLTIGAAIAAFHTNGPTFNLSRADPSFHNTAGYLMIGLLSASMGLQGVVGESLGSGFTATVVLTSIYCQLAIIKWPWKLSPARDDRVLAVLLFGLGGAVAHFSLVGIESHGTLCIAAGIRFLQIPVWLLCKSSEENRLLPTTLSRTMSRRLALTPTDTQATATIEKAPEAHQK